MDSLSLADRREIGVAEPHGGILVLQRGEDVKNPRTRRSHCTHDQLAKPEDGRYGYSGRRPSTIMPNASLSDAEPDVAQIQLVQHLDAALVADDAVEKDFHIRHALQLFVAIKRL